MRSIAKRHKYILNQLKINGYVKVQDLSESLGVSDVTIRKDLRTLEKQKLLVRTHGSASALTALITDRHIDEKEKLFSVEKERIAAYSNDLLESNDKIVIASGTTLLTFAHHIDLQKILTVITSSVKVSLTLSYHPNIEIVQLGGALRKNSVSVVGNYAELILDTLSCNKLFLGVDGIDLNYGLTTSNVSEAYINQKMIEVSDEVIVLTDSSKFGQRGFCKICGLEKIDHIVTDTGAPAHMVEVIRKMGIKVTLV